MLVADDFRFRAPSEGSAHAHDDRVLFLNLTFWGAGASSDVLVDASIDADVLAHAAWHHAARKALASATAPTPAALFLGESVASAFDLYVVGQMLRSGQRSAYLSSQVPAMTLAALGAGLDEAALGALLGSVAEDPDRAFADLRALLFDASLALWGCADLDAAVSTLDGFRDHRFASLLHHFALSSWVLYARAHGGPPVEGDVAIAMEQSLREAPVALEWLEGWL